MSKPITVVTATTRPEDTKEFWSTWFDTASRPDLLTFITVVNGPKYRIHSSELPGAQIPKRQHNIRMKSYMGTVPAFAMAAGHEAANGIIACLHDDLQILERGWDEALRDIFSGPRVGLAGFGGATSVGVKGMYDKPFDPMTLARHNFMSNMRDAESHGERVEELRQVAVLDGFSLCFDAGVYTGHFEYLKHLGIIHHAYDVAIGALMVRDELETWFVPVKCHHAGGRTAVADPGYAEWAKTQCPAGDQGIWFHAHQFCWKEFADVLPFGV